MHHKQTDVCRLDTEDELALFCEKLKSMKAAAPKSLRITIAITTERDVHVRKIREQKPPRKKMRAIMAAPPRKQVNAR